MSSRASGPGRNLPTRTPGVIARPVADGVVVIHPGTQQAHALTGVSAQVWRALDGGSMPALGGAEIDEALDNLVAIGLVQLPGLSRRSILQRTGLVVAATGITSIALPNAVAAASTLQTATITLPTGTVTIPAGARDVKISVTGGSGGVASSFPGLAGSSGRVDWNIGANYRLPSALTVTYNVGRMGSDGTAAGPGAGGAGAFAGGSGADGNSSGGGGGGGASKLTFSGAASGFVIAGGGGGSGEGPTNGRRGGAGGSVDGTGTGMAGGSGANPNSVGGAGGGAVGGTGVAGGSATANDFAGGGGGGGGKMGGAGTSEGTVIVASTTNEVAGGGGAGSNSINNGVALALNGVSPSSDTSSTGNGTLVITYITG